MNKPRCSSAAVVCNNSIYVIGGHDGTTIFKSVERKVLFLLHFLSLKA